MQSSFIKIIVSFVLALALTWLAERKSLHWAGIIIAYPSLTTSIGLILLIKYSGTELKTFLKSAIFGWLPTAVYLFSLVFTYEIFGLVIGTITSVFIATLVVVILKTIQNNQLITKLNY